MTINNKIVLGITGGIAAYKSAELARLLVKAGAQVKIVMTSNAQKFITALTMQAITGHEVYANLFVSAAAMEHINLARWADIVLVAPASANFMAQLALGSAADLLSSLCLATTAPLVIVPAMNQVMWHHAATQANRQVLQQRAVHILGPELGSQACGDHGLGRMMAPETIIEHLPLLVRQPHQLGPLAGVRIVITAGPTRENLDPVRFLSNHSSGKMGYALAHAAVAAGAKVTLISGPVLSVAAPAAAALISVTTAQEMCDAVLARVNECDIFIGVAAVADYYCPEPAQQKIAKQQSGCQLTLLATPDIIKLVSACRPRPFIVGFAAETHDLLSNAMAKLKNKGMDVIIANQVGADQGINSDDNEVTVLWQKAAIMQSLSLARQPKITLAQQLIQLLASLYNNQEHYSEHSSA